MLLNRRRFMASSAALATGSLGLPALAQPHDGIVRIVLGFPPGNAFDAMARLYAERLAGKYAKTVIVENRPGAAGRIALDQVRRADADGRTIIFVPSPLFTLYPYVYKKLNYDPVKDFEPAATTFATSAAIAVGSSVPATVKTVPQFIEWAKAQKQSLNFSTNAQGSLPHFLGLSFAEAAGFKLNFVPYGSVTAPQALMAGDLDMVSMNIGGLSTAVRSGKARLLATFNPERLKAFPDMPTLRELGYKDLSDQEWGGLFFPKGTPQASVSLLEKLMRDIMAEPGTHELYNRLSVQPLYRNAKDTAQTLANELVRYKPIVAAAGLDLVD